MLTSFSLFFFFRFLFIFSSFIYLYHIYIYFEFGSDPKLTNRKLGDRPQRWPVFSQKRSITDIRLVLNTPLFLL